MADELFHIISDSSCDLPEELVKENNVTVVPFYVSFGDSGYKKEIVDIKVRDFYQQMVDNPKVFPKSSMPSVADYMDVMTPFVKENKPVICICITIKFSGSYQSACNARDMLLEEYPDAKISVIDSTIDTVLQGLYVIEAVKLRDAGYTYDKALKRLDEIKSTGRIFFTVGSFDYLKVNGRIGKVAVSMSSILGIRPIITLKEGEIFPSGIARSRKQTIKKTLDVMGKYVDEVHATPQTFAVDIGYGYDYDEAVEFRKQIVDVLAEHGFYISEDDIPIFQIGSGIGVHTGPYPLGVTMIERGIHN